MIGQRTRHNSVSEPKNAVTAQSLTRAHPLTGLLTKHVRVSPMPYPQRDTLTVIRSSAQRLLWYNGTRLEETGRDNTSWGKP
jgi:hypothetical protein